MKISVIIPSYKPKEYLWECLDSLRTQTMDPKDFEIILILNGGCEPYLSEIKAYISRRGMTNIKLIQTDTPGVSNARNIGIEVAQGEYIAFIDDDDYVSPSYLQKLYEISVKGITPVSNVVYFDDETDKTIDNFLKQRYEKIKNRGVVGIMAAKSYLSVPVAKALAYGTVRSGRFNNSYKIGEDGLYMFEISYLLNRFEATSEDCIYYRRCRQGSAMTASRPISELLMNSLSLMWKYTQAYFKHPIKTNFILYLSRLAAEAYTFVVLQLKR